MLYVHWDLLLSSSILSLFLLLDFFLLIPGSTRICKKDGLFPAGYLWYSVRTFVFVDFIAEWKTYWVLYLHKWDLLGKFHFSGVWQGSQVLAGSPVHENLEGLTQEDPHALAAILSPGSLSKCSAEGSLWFFSSTALHSGVNWHRQTNLIPHSFPLEPQSHQILSQDCILTRVQSPFEM